jgi:hypothetical protein
MSGSLPESTVCDLVSDFNPCPHPISRFRLKQYAPIDIVLTEKKGFGLRAAKNLTRSVLLSVPAIVPAFLHVFVPSVQGYVYLRICRGCP